MKYQKNPWSRMIAYLLIITICLGTSILHLPVVEVQAESTTDGLEYTVNYDQTVTITYYKGSATELQIPAEIDGHSVTSIGDSAFKNRRSLTNIVIPDSVTDIGASAFENCSDLTSIKIPDNVTDIGDSAFSGCSSLTSIEIPDSVVSFGWYAFSGCSSLTSIEIPNSIKSIGSNAFSGCNNLIAINVDSENAAYASVEGVLLNKELTKLIKCPQGKAGKYNIPDSVTDIGNGAFEDCSGLTSIEIPNSVTIIRYGVFDNCSGLTSIEIPNSVTSILSYAFGNCSGLTSIEIPDSVTDIGDSTFYGCSSLTSIEIPNSVTAIEYESFSGCSSLASIEIPDSVTYIGDSAFYCCSSLASIVIPNGVTYIGSETFGGCNSLTSIEIPDSVTYIGDRAFYGCSSLLSIKMPDSVTYIGNGAFGHCNGLTSIAIPNNVISIGNGAFENCSSLASIVIPNGVTNIGSETFSGCKSLISIEIPDSVTYIGHRAFYGCSSLLSIKMPHSVTDIGSELFSGCNSLTSIVIPDSVTSIEEYAFDNCISLTSIEIPNSVTDIGYGAFENCSSLIAISVDSGNTVYASVEGVLLDKELTTLITCPRGKEGTYSIPESVTSIGTHAFYGCSSLTSIKIPESVTSIKSGAFYDTAVDHVIFGGNQDAWNKLSENWKDDDILRFATVHYDTEENVIIPEAPVLPDCINNGYTTYKCSLCEKEYRSDFVSPTGHSFQDNICTKCGRSIEDCIESAHPYENNADETYTISRPGAERIKITFSSATKLHDTDKILIYDKNENLYKEYYGSQLASEQISVRGDSVIIQLVSNESGMAYGFAISDIEAIMPQNDFSAEAYYDGDDTVVVDVYAKGNIQAFDIGIGYDAEEVTCENSKIASDYLKQCEDNGHIEIKRNKIDDERIGSYCFVASASEAEAVKNYDGLIASFQFHVTKPLPKLRLYKDLTGYPELIMPEIPINQDICFEIKPDDTITISGGIGIPQNVYIPDRIWDMPVTEIADYAFDQASQLEEIRFPNELKKIGDNAFGGCFLLKSISIPDSVTNIGDYAFSSCNLSNVSISKNVQSIGAPCFPCDITVDEQNPNYSSSNGILYDKDMTTLLSYPRTRESETFEIPEGVTRIGDNAFMGSALKMISIPDQVIEIGNGAFMSCEDLTEVKLPSTLRQIPDDAFYNCYNLTDIKIPDGVESIGSCAFYNCFNLTDIKLPDGVESIGSNAFCSCFRLTDIDIPDHVVSIGTCAFIWCSGLKNIEIPESVTEIGNMAFGWITELKNVKIYARNAVIDDEAFHGCETMNIQCYPGSTAEQFAISNNIPYALFGDSDEFQLLISPDNTISIDGYTGNETEITIPSELDGNTVTTIADGAFKDSPVTSIVLPESVTKIGAGAFAGSDLKRITITANEVEIAEDAFEGCENVIICCYSASKAYAFAQAHGIVLELLDEKPAFVYGDLDDSGNVDASDALLILRIAAKLQTPTEEQNIAGDVDNSGSVNANDALYVLKKAAKLIEVFPAEAK